MEEKGLKEEEKEFLEMYFEMLEENLVRSLLIADIWGMDSYEETGRDVSKEQFLEIYRQAAFDVLDVIMSAVPPEEAVSVGRILDHELNVELINRTYDIDIMSEFQREFVESHGSAFETLDDFTDLVAKFEVEWANTPKDYLNGLTPNQALETTMKKWLKRKGHE